MTHNLTPVAVVHAAITAYRAMDVRHRAVLDRHADDDGEVPEGAMPDYEDDRLICALEADGHLEALMEELTDAFGLPTDQPVPVLGSEHHIFEVTPGRLDDVARKAFTHGQCHALALALSEVTGWPATALLTSDCFDAEAMCANGSGDECPCRIGHIVVTRPDGAHVDITGAHTPGTIPGYEDAETLPMAEVHWNALASSSAWREADMPAARMFVKPLLAELPALSPKEFP
ncbi:hypothetical protein ACFVHW_04275 [Streptomyces sp. NPDC127110]|uniref:hypothetical protein n=1 Tax=Streptomyces sp. NPDC127110 TaxID=3345362 RepID=UPI0036291017